MFVRWIKLPLQLFVLVVVAVLTIVPSAVAQNACGVLTAEQVSSFLGAKATAKEIGPVGKLGAGEMCAWMAATGGLQVIVTSRPFPQRQAFEQMYAAARKGMPMGRVEAGLGDRAISITDERGIVFEIVKGPTFVQLAAATHASPTAAEHDALRKIAENVLAKL